MKLAILHLLSCGLSWGCLTVVLPSILQLSFLRTFVVVLVSCLDSAVFMEYSLDPPIIWGGWTFGGRVKVIFANWVHFQSSYFFKATEFGRWFQNTEKSAVQTGFSQRILFWFASLWVKIFFLEMKMNDDNQVSVLCLSYYEVSEYIAKFWILGSSGNFFSTAVLIIFCCFVSIMYATEIS